MATKDMRIIVNGTVLPLYSTLLEKLTPIESENVTLDGTLYTDYINNRRGWVAGWDKLKAADYDIIRALYNAQYTTEAVPVVQLVEYGIVAPMKMNISDRNIRMNGEIIEGVTVTFKEQYAIS
jgi:hypothetical protein